VDDQDEASDRGQSDGLKACDDLIARIAGARPSVKMSDPQRTSILRLVWTAEWSKVWRSALPLSSMKCIDQRLPILTDPEQNREYLMPKLGRLRSRARRGLGGSSTRTLPARPRALTNHRGSGEVVGFETGPYVEDHPTSVDPPDSGPNITVRIATATAQPALYAPRSAMQHDDSRSNRPRCGGTSPCMAESPPARDSDSDDESFEPCLATR